MELRPVGGFNMLMIDPPWLIRTNSPAAPGKNPASKYACAPRDWIKALPIRDALAADDALVWLWAINPMLDQALDVLQAWGFRFCTSGHWAKTTKTGKQHFGTGFVLRNAGEPFLLGKIGRPKTTRATRSVVMGLARTHSQKPEEGYVAAQALMPDAHRIELFSRTDRPGWTCWGAEAGKLNATTITTEGFA
jgi:N6-adenosine-specific RNA methylase IME4